MPIKSNLNGLIEVIGLNSITLSVATFTNIETILKIVLLALSIIYTYSKLRQHFKQNNGQK